MKLATLIIKYAAKVKAIIEEDSNIMILEDFHRATSLLANRINQHPNLENSCQKDTKDFKDTIETIETIDTSQPNFDDIYNRFVKNQEKLKRIEIEYLSLLAELGKNLQTEDFIAFNDNLFYLCHSEFLLPNLLVKYKCLSTKITPEGLYTINKKLSMSAFSLLCTKKQTIKLLHKIIKQNIKKQTNLVENINEGAFVCNKLVNLNPFRSLCSYEYGYKIIVNLLKQKPDLVNLLSQEALFGVDEETKLTSFYLLLRNPHKAKNIIYALFWKFPEKFDLITKEALTAIVPETKASSLLHIFGNKYAMKLLRKSKTLMKNLPKWLTKEVLYTVDKEKQCSVFFILCRIQGSYKENLKLLLDAYNHNRRLLYDITPESIFTIVPMTQESAFFWLIQPQNIKILQLLFQSNNFNKLILNHITPKALYTRNIDHEISTFHSMLSLGNNFILDLLLLMLKNNPILKHKLTEDILCKKVKVDKLPAFFWLFGRLECLNVALYLFSDATIYKKITPQALCSIFSKTKVSALYMMVKNPEIYKEILYKIFNQDEILKGITHEAFYTLDRINNFSAFIYFAACDEKLLQILNKIFTVNKKLLSNVPKEALFKVYNANQCGFSILTRCSTGLSILLKILQANLGLLRHLSHEILFTSLNPSYSTLDILHNNTDGREIIKLILKCSPKCNEILKLTLKSQNMEEIYNVNKNPPIIFERNYKNSKNPKSLTLPGDEDLDMAAIGMFIRKNSLSHSYNTIESYLRSGAIKLKNITREQIQLFGKYWKKLINCNKKSKVSFSKMTSNLLLANMLHFCTHLFLIHKEQMQKNTKNVNKKPEGYYYINAFLYYIKCMQCAKSCYQQSSSESNIKEQIINTYRKAIFDINELYQGILVARDCFLKGLSKTYVISEEAKSKLKEMVDFFFNNFKDDKLMKDYISEINYNESIFFELGFKNEFQTKTNKLSI